MKILVWVLAKNRDQAEPSLLTLLRYGIFSSLNEVTQVTSRKFLFN